MYVTGVKSMHTTVSEGTSSITLSSLLRRTDPKTHDLVLGPKPTLADLIREKVVVLEAVMGQLGESTDSIMLDFEPGKLLEGLGLLVAAKEKELGLVCQAAGGCDGMNSRLCMEYVKGRCGGGCGLSHSRGDVAQWVGEFLAEQDEGVVEIDSELRDDVLAEALGRVGVWDVVRTLKISKISTKTGAKTLFKMFGNYELQNIVTLDLSGSNLADPELTPTTATLSAALRAISTLKTLLMNDVNLSDKAILTVAASFDSPHICNSVETLSLQGNALRHNSRRLPEIVEALSRSPNLTTLDLSRNPLNDSVPLFSTFLKTNTVLKDIRLEDVGMTPQGLTSLCTGLASNKTLTATSFGCNPLTHDALQNFFTTLADHSALTTIRFTSTVLPTPPQGTSPLRLTDYLRANTTCETLDFTHTPLPEPTLSSLTEGLQGNSTLHDLKLTEKLVEKRVYDKLRDKIKKKEAPGALSVSIPS